MASPNDDEIRGLATQVASRLRSAGLTLAVAESCTGGWLAKACTDLPGSSGWFLGGLVAYSNRAKSAVLGVREDTLAEAGAVSEATVREMAAGVLGLIGSDVSIAVSGIAGPDGGQPGKPVGTVWFAWASVRDGHCVVRAEARVFDGDRDAVRRQAVARALQGVGDP